MSKFRDVKGMSVITLAEGKKVGQVEDLIVDPEARAVRWLRLGGAGGGLFSGPTTTWVRSEAIHGIGEHAVTINRESDLLRSEDAPEAVEMAKSGRALLGKKVLTEGGRFLGESRDFKFSPEDFRLTSLVVGQGNALSQQALEIDARYLHTIGQDVVVVAEGAEAVAPEEFEQQNLAPADTGISGRAAATNQPAQVERRQVTDEPRPVYRPAGAPPMRDVPEGTDYRTESQPDRDNYGPETATGNDAGSATIYRAGQDRPDTSHIPPADEPRR